MNDVYDSCLVQPNGLPTHITLKPMMLMSVRGESHKDEMIKTHETQT